MDVERHEWRVSRAVTAAKAGAVAICLLLAVVGDTRLRILVGVAGLGFAVLLLRDLIAPVRLAAGAEGLTVVRGFAGSERIPWASIDRMRVDTFRRYGRNFETLEIDTGDQIHLLSRHDLGAPVVDVAETLMRLRP
jgi:hypothetical protein